MDEVLANLDPSERLSVDLVGCESLEQQADRILAALKGDIFYLRWRQLAWQNFKQEGEKAPELSNSKLIKAFMDTQNNREILKNISAKVYERSITQSAAKVSRAVAPNEAKRKGATSNSLLPRLSRRSVDESVEHIRQARVAWEQGILEELRAIVFESRRPFLIVREPGAVSPWLDATPTSSSSTTANGSGDGAPPPPVSSPAPPSNSGEGVKFLFDSEDLMETILAIRNPHIKTAHSDRYLGLMKLSLKVPEYSELQRRFAELQISYSQLGVDDLLLNPQGAAAGMKLLALRHEECESLLANGNGASMLEARKLMRRGVPPSLRNRIWRVACGLADKPSVTEEQSFLRLRAECDRLDLITDELFMHDIQTVLDDPRFFVFEDEIKDVVLSFSRDAAIRHLAVYEVHCPLLQQMGTETAMLGHHQGVALEGLAAPPCAVQPYLGFATYFAPAAYIFQSKVSLYHVTKFLWCRLWCRLNVMSSDEGALLALCRCFESLLMRAHPRLFLHLQALGLPPLKVAFPWMQLAFVGFLEVEQLLHLWERVIGFMDITLLAVTAAAIFVYRAEMLLRCTNEADALNVLLEGSRLQVVPILQAFLMKE